MPGDVIKKPSTNVSAAALDEAAAPFAAHLTVNCQYRGRLGNQLIQSTYCGLYAITLGVRAWPPVCVNKGNNTGAMKIADAAGNDNALGECVPWHPSLVPPAAELATATVFPPQSTEGRRDTFHQNYEYYRGQRDRVRRMAVPDGPYWLAEDDGGMIPGEDDVVIHLRLFEMGAAHLCTAEALASACERWGHPRECSYWSEGVEPQVRESACLDAAAHPPFEYFARILAEREAKVSGAHRPPVVHLVYEPKSATHPLVERLRTELVGGDGAPLRVVERVRSAHADMQFILATRAAIITTGGTFSWFSAFASSAREIHTSFTSNLWDSIWYPAHALFVDDMPEYHFHDTEAGRYFMTGPEVLASGTPFAEAVAKRERDPMPRDRTAAWEALHRNPEARAVLKELAET